MFHRTSSIIIIIASLGIYVDRKSSPNATVRFLEWLCIRQTCISILSSPTILPEMNDPSNKGWEATYKLFRASVLRATESPYGAAYAAL
jgi:hypothetical protein